MKQRPIYTEIGSRIRSRRKQLRLTQEALANRLELSRASLANIETGRQSVLVHRLYPIARALKLNVADLLPPLPNPLDDGDTAELPLSQDLSPQQRMQITRLINDDSSA